MAKVMSFIPVDRAFGLTLLGLDPRKVLDAGQALDTSGRGFTAAAWGAQLQQPGPVKVGARIMSLNGVKTEVPVYRFSMRGKRKLDNYPAIAYELVGLQFNGERYVYQADGFSDPVPESMVNVVLPNGKTVQGPSLRRKRPHPEPWDLLYTVRAYTKNNYESFALEQVLLETLPARNGALFGLDLSGKPRSWELRHMTANNIDDEEPTLTDSDTREFAWVHTYVVETHLDNTLAWELKRTLTSAPEIDVDISNPPVDYRRPTLLTITTAQPVVGVGQQLPMAVTVTYADGTQADVTAQATWSSADPSIAKVEGQSIVIGVAAQRWAWVYAEYGGLKTATIVNVV